VNGEVHRDGDLPAVIYGEIRQWYKNGVFIKSEGEEEW
jgi:hypothetical protein